MSQQYNVLSFLIFLSKHSADTIDEYCNYEKLQKRAHYIVAT